MRLIVTVVAAVLVVASGVNAQGQEQKEPTAASAEVAVGSAQAPGQEWVDPAVGMRFRYVPAGKFTVGSPESETGREIDELRHEVALTRGYFIGETEVTQAQWRAVMDDNPSRISTCGDSCPVEAITWLEAVEFVNALSRKASLTECYQVSGESVTFVGLSCTGYRLPTEAEWEHAAVAAGPGPYAGSDNLDAVAWFEANSAGSTHPAGEKQANAWGIFDMSGNVGEWVWDWYDDYPSLLVTDPLGPTTGTQRVVRGGNWRFVESRCRVADRGKLKPDHRLANLGLRLARSAP